MADLLVRGVEETVVRALPTGVALLNPFHSPTDLAP